MNLTGLFVWEKYEEKGNRRNRLIIRNLALKLVIQVLYGYLCIYANF